MKILAIASAWLALAELIGFVSGLHNTKRTWALMRSWFLFLLSGRVLGWW